VVTVLRQVPLRFTEDAVDAGTHVNLSAVRTDGPCLWIAGDETATVERLTADGDGYGAHVSFPLADVVELPGESDDEVDIEGLGRSGPFLWAVGSHSGKRKRIKGKHGDAKSLRRLTTVLDEPARRVLARLTVADGPDGLPTIVREGSAVLGEPGLRAVLADDAHLAPFLAIPGKDNGFDIEGVAVHGEPGAETLFLGLRGPVLRGWAVVLEIRPREHAPGRLQLDPLDGKACYRLHVLDLDGLGVRDLCPDGADLLVLAGPSMDLDGPVRVYRWCDAVHTDVPGVVRGSALHREADLPHGRGDDHAEGITLLPGGELLVVHDSPAPARLSRPGTVLADVVALGTQESGQARRAGGAAP